MGVLIIKQSLIMLFFMWLTLTFEMQGGLTSAYNQGKKRSMNKQKLFYRVKMACNVNKPETRKHFSLLWKASATEFISYRVKIGVKIWLLGLAVYAVD